MRTPKRKANPAIFQQIRQDFREVIGPKVCQVELYRQVHLLPILVGTIIQIPMMGPISIYQAVFLRCSIVNIQYSSNRLFFVVQMEVWGGPQMRQEVMHYGCLFLMGV